MSIHANSLAAYDAGKRELFSARQLQILDYMIGNNARTDREIMRGLGFADMNAVRPRITELIASGVLFEVGTQQCPVTDKWVRLVSFNRPVGQQEFAL